MYFLKCPNCGELVESPFRNVVCVKCGNIAVEPPLTAGTFEQVGEDNEAIKPEKKKPVENKEKPPAGAEVF